MAASKVPGQRDRYDAPQNASQSSTSSDGIQFNNIIVPDHEVKATGAIRRSQYQSTQVTGPTPQARVIATRSNEDEVNKENKSEKNEGANESKLKREAIACAGPSALQSLRKEFHRTTLSRLPDWKTLEFSEHSKPAIKGYARLCIEIGKYGEKGMSKWSNAVLAYLAPNVNPKIGPNLSMEVKQMHARGHDFVEITWQDDIALGRVDLVQPFNQASSEPELSENDFYTDKDKSPKSYPRAPDRRRQAGYALRPGVATTKPYPGIDDTNDFIQDNDRDLTSQSSLESGEILESLFDNFTRIDGNTVDARASETPKSQRQLQLAAIKDKMEEDQGVDVNSRDIQAQHFRSIYEVGVEEKSDKQGNMRKTNSPAKHASSVIGQRQPTDHPADNSRADDADNLPELGRKSDTARTVTNDSKTQMVIDNLGSWTGITRPPMFSRPNSRVSAKVSDDGSASFQSRHRAPRPSSSALRPRSRDSQRRREREDKRAPTDPNPMNKHRATAHSAGLPVKKILKAGKRTLSGRIDKKPGIRQKIKHVQELGVTQANILKEMIADHEKAKAKHEKMKAEHDSMVQKINRELKEIIGMISDEPEEEEEEEDNGSASLRVDTNNRRHTMSTASVNLTRLRKLLGESAASTLIHAPLDRIVTKHQFHEPNAISFMFLFGTIIDKSTGRSEEVWILFYPPAENNGAAVVEFHAYDAASNTSIRFEKQNICTMITEVAPAFKTPKRSSKAKYEALAKYYFLEKLASMESQEGGAVELQAEVFLSQTLLDALKTVCIEFKKHAESQIPTRESRSLSATLIGDPDRVAQLLSAAPEPGTPFVKLPPHLALRPRAETFHADKIDVLVDLRIKEAEIDAATEDAKKELSKLQEARAELQRELQKLEQGLENNREDKMKIVAQREEFLKGMSLVDVFDLGSEVERTRPEKRQRLT
ncbi:hypothetical protein CFE70_001524 [Pyrenophora teres f. teres 0-1]